MSEQVETEPSSTAAELRAVVDRLARSVLDMTGVEFEAKWQAGDFDGQDNPAVRRIAAVLPLA